MSRKRSRFSPFLKQCFVTSAVGINLIGHGAVVGFAAVLLPQLSNPHSDIHTSKTANSWIASVIGITLLIGSFLASPLMGRYGRKVAHYTISVTALVGWLTTILANSVEVILIGRIIGGLSFGMMLPLRSILIGEYTSPKNRGAFLTTISLTQGCGIFFVHLVGSLLSWRQTALVCLFLPFVSLIMTLFTPESPSWLVSKGRYNECREVFHWLRGDEEETELEAMIEARVNFEKTMRNQKKLDIIKTVQKQEFYKPIILMVHVYAMGQLSGAATIAAYGTTVIELVMHPGVNSSAWMIGLDSQRVIVNTLAIFVINWFKRRAMVFSTGILCVASHLAIVAYVYLKDQDVLSSEAIWIPGILLNIQFFSVSLGMVPLPSVIAGEVFPLEYRSLAGSISQASVAGTMFLVLKTFPGLVDSIGITGTYLVYAGLLTYCLFVIMFLMPETKGRTLQEIEDGYRGGVVVEEEMRSLKSNGENGKVVSTETKT
ncbi:facilitated trehalose transporter Tret1-like [Spodoptera litura]|uniref:Facilitated trehalose transporter Tret1-like n=1 Tax=Spodoptera litura TaxID=69820 RepID=A0A9J7EVE3_SPOLT|nr:facilitated trehalose transporter Tret1-like [Spodoptera litura]